MNYHVSNKLQQLRNLWRFEELLNEIEGQMEESLISFFIGVLKHEIKKQLKLGQSMGLGKAFTKAKAHGANKGYIATYTVGYEGKLDPIIKT